jgi:UDP-glucose 4-epimerase
MKIAVTGGAGFIGSNIVDAYIDLGHDVVILDNLSTGKKENINPDAKFIEIDITSPDISSIFEEEKFDVLNHHAAQIDVRVSVDDPLLDAKSNILGSLNLFESCRNTGVKKIIFASSAGTVYGDQEYFPADEDHPKMPISPYGITKYTCENYINFYSKTYGIKKCILRYTNIYGPRQNPHGEAGVVAIFTNRMLADQKAIINGDGKFTRDYVYVGDVVVANIMALDKDFIGTYNIATGVEHDVNFIFRSLKEFTGSTIEEIHGPAKLGETERSVCSYDKIYQDHGWKPGIDFRTGLGLTVEWFKSKLKK